MNFDFEFWMMQVHAGLENKNRVPLRNAYYPKVVPGVCLYNNYFRISSRFVNISFTVIH